MLTSKQKIKRALAALDTAIQAWYDENHPNDTERYATMHIRNYPDGHVSHVTLYDKARDKFIDIRSSKDTTL